VRVLKISIKRINSKTSQIFERGDVREDGFYFKGEKICIFSLLITNKQLNYEKGEIL
tara:strand:+ start:86 stop:256 length:171 start_codon:yes stop_codon:yes gene_type:complete